VSDNVPPPYGAQPPQPPYGHQPYGYGPPQDHPQSTTVLVLGILGLVMCQIISPIAWVMGNRVVREIDASGGTLGGRANANAGRICGMIGTALIGLGLLVVAAAVIIVVAGAASA
jgi:uncharacterized membrane protein YjgN (DUF898 family)